MLLGLVFTFNFGLVPSTRGADGDALDVLLFAAPAFSVGSVALGRLVGVLEAVQIEEGRKQRNDRLLTVPIEMVSRKTMLPTIELDTQLKKAINEFFNKYNELQGKKFRSLGYGSTAVAVRLIRKANATWINHRRKLRRVSKIHNRVACPIPLFSRELTGSHPSSCMACGSETNYFEPSVFSSLKGVRSWRGTEAQQASP